MRLEKVTLPMHIEQKEGFIQSLTKGQMDLAPEHVHYLCEVFNTFFEKLEDCKNVPKQGAVAFKERMHTYARTVAMHMLPELREVFLTQAQRYVDVCATQLVKEASQEGAQEEGGQVDTPLPKLKVHLERFLIHAAQNPDLSMMHPPLLEDYDMLLKVSVRLGALTEDEAIVAKTKMEQEMVKGVVAAEIITHEAPTFFALQVASGKTPFPEVNVLPQQEREAFMVNIFNKNKKGASHA